MRQRQRCKYTDREKERDRETQTERQTETERYRERERDTEREKYRESVHSESEFRPKQRKGGNGVMMVIIYSTHIFIKYTQRDLLKLIGQTF